MRTVGRHKPRSAPFGDYQASCDYCGVVWYVYWHGMGRDRSGLLSCRDCKDYEGRDGMTLSEENAHQSAQPSGRRGGPREGANFDQTALFQEEFYARRDDQFEL